MTIPANDLSTAIVAISSGIALSLGTNLFPGPIQPVSTFIPVNCLFVNELSGSNPQRVMTQTSEFRGAMVMLTLRWSQYTAGKAKMKEIMDGLLGTTPAGYLDMFTVQSEPNHSGPTEEGHHIFSTIYSMRYKQDAA